jgi:hypothetical protein
MQSDFGDPTDDTDVRICVYEGDGKALVMEAIAAGGGTCGGEPCWEAISNGYRVLDASAAQNGLTKILLRGHPVASRTRLLFKGQGESLPLPTLPFSSADDVLVRVHNSTTGSCWGADFTPGDVLRNDAEMFKARAP